MIKQTNGINENIIKNENANMSSTNMKETNFLSSTFSV